MKHQIPLIIDSDPGVDDALALRMIYCSGAFDVRLACSVAGNVSLDLTTANLLYLTQIWGDGIPVCRGCVNPLGGSDTSVHGAGGLGGYQLPPFDSKPDERGAVQAMYETLTASDERVTFITLGPLTNVAKLLQEHPETAGRIDRIYAMIASKDGTGNITEYAEFNAYCDPAALDTVIHAGVVVVFAPMHLGREARLSMNEMLARAQKSNEKSMMEEMFAGYYDRAVGDGYVAMYDANAVTALLHPELYEFVPCTAEVNLDERPGQTYLQRDEKGQFFRLEIKDPQALADAMLKDLFPGAD